MNAALRRRFDTLLEQVLDELPSVVMDLLDSVPLIVDDYPSPRVLREMGVGPGEDLCGLYTGVPLGERVHNRVDWIPETISIYRSGIINLASPEGEPDDEELKRQIRITVLHEVGHHFGMTEEQLREVGYD